MRADLLALTTESLTLLANVGLVKRAQREVEAGSGPAIDEGTDGTVVARSRDGATTRLPRDTPLKNAPCSCGAAGVCRHRVAAVLAYQRTHAGVEVASRQPWDPGEFSDDALASLCGDAALVRARSLLRASFLVVAHPGALPVAKLPASTVQFLVPHDLAFAKCDCTKGHACEHLVLAVWAFRRSPAGGVVELGSPEDTESTAALAQLDAALAVVVARGISGPGVADEIGRARASAERAGLVWIADGLEDLERQREAYDRQSALFSSRSCSFFVAELAARRRAASRCRTVPPRWLLGSDEPRETHLEQVRLVSLGARLEADNERRFAEVVFADRDTKSVLVLRKEWTFPAGQSPKNGHELAEMFASSRLSLAALARGELLTRAARRSANGMIDLSAARGMKSSLLPTAGGWDDLPEPLLVRDLAAFGASTKDRPPALLRPRRRGDEVHVVAVARVVDVAYHRGEQELVGFVEDAAGTRLRLRTRHRTVSPGAVGSVREALEEGPRFVSGELERTTRGWEMSPLAIASARLRVPDLERPSGSSEARGAHEAPRTELDALLDALDELVDRGLHKGSASIRAQAKPLGTRLREAGMSRVAALVQQISEGGDERLLDLAIVRALIHQVAPND